MRQKWKFLLVQWYIYAMVAVEEGSPCQEDPKCSANVTYTVRLSQRNRTKTTAKESELGSLGLKHFLFL